MKLIDNIKIFKNKYRYHKFKSSSLPYPFWDKKRNIFNWIYYDAKYDDYEINCELYESFTNRIYTFTYHYEIKSYSKKNIKKEIPNRVEVSHVHNFNEVLKALYDYPNTFSIPNEYLNEYSKQELMFIKQLQNYFKLIELKDVEESNKLKEINDKYENIKNKKSFLNKIQKYFLLKKERKLKKKEWLNRTNNSKAFYYDSLIKMYVDKEEVLNSMLKGNKNYKIYRYNNFKKVDNRYLVIDQQLNYRMVIKIVDEKIMKLKDLEENMVDYKILGYKSFSDYKRQMIIDFNYSNLEKFTEDSLISYCTFEILEKF